ncbi:SGNH/GDSL hydrolase family protein [Methylobacterium sp. GC_Met_2]|uniref:SGNH/GDSL hydrolase family protein n=1 Tax=Methylobacterium sp. GC_Met_2 TaxID=2937376 RepID=UPI00226B555F|nr:SGNH/GDSL hydrolase family protein [Methylobacterium sp. GC_Met_2]
MPIIRAALRTAPNGYVALVGDSHAEFLGTPDFGGRSCVNLGIGGSTAADCARHLASLHPDAGATAAVLFVGTNDILRWRHPDRPTAADCFTDDVDRILQTLSAWAEQIFVAAVPPIGPWTTGRDPAAVIAFTERLRALCGRSGFTFFDPFAGIRDGASGFALAGLHRDGFHLADYPGLAKEVVRLVSLRVAPSQVPTIRAASTSTRDRHPRASNRTFGAVRLRFYPTTPARSLDC